MNGHGFSETFGSLGKIRKVIMQVAINISISRYIDNERNVLHDKINQLWNTVNYNKGISDDVDWLQLCINKSTGL